MIAVPLIPPLELCISLETRAILSSPASTPNSSLAVARACSDSGVTLQPPLAPPSSSNSILPRCNTAPTIENTDFFSDSDKPMWDRACKILNNAGYYY